MNFRLYYLEVLRIHCDCENWKNDYLIQAAIDKSYSLVIAVDRVTNVL